MRGSSCSWICRRFPPQFSVTGSQAGMLTLSSPGTARPMANSPFAPLRALPAAKTTCAPAIPAPSAAVTVPRSTTGVSAISTGWMVGSVRRVEAGSNPAPSRLTSTGPPGHAMFTRPSLL